MQVDRPVLIIQPTRIAPAGPHNNITARVQNGCDAIRLQVGTIAYSDLSRHDGDPVQLLAAVLVGQLEVPEALGSSPGAGCRQIERRVDAPEFVGLLGLRTRFHHRRGIDQADQTPARRYRGGRIVSQSPQRRRRYRTAGLEISARPLAAAHAAVARNPRSPRQ